MGMEINIKVNLLTGFHKDMVNIFGLMVQYLKVILNRDLGMVMDSGKVQKEQPKSIKAITCLIKNMVMEKYNGLMEKYIKE
jgi:hypothetical protein